MTPCRDLNDEGALPGLCKSACWSRDKEGDASGRPRKKKRERNNEGEMGRWEINDAGSG